MNVYDISVKGKKGEDVSLSKYKGKALLIVNTATQCGFTPQYDELQAFYKKYQDKGFEILDFPSNQFDGQAPESIEEIDNICNIKFGTQFPRFAKIEVNGKGESPLYTFLKSKKGFKGFDMNHKIAPILLEILTKNDPDYAKNPSIKWNFTKFLIDRQGNVVQRFEPTHVVAAVSNEIGKIL
ncbi:MAG TPA: glutathione peroxidase [Bacteroidales bacterium]|nr:glutathione peroxidase [Bacteroidales bacterium]